MGEIVWSKRRRRVHAMVHLCTVDVVSFGSCLNQKRKCLDYSRGKQEKKSLLFVHFLIIFFLSKGRAGVCEVG